MPEPRRARTRKHSGGEASRNAIIECAQALFANHGVDGVSMRQIGASVGSANTTVVAYHFGDRDGLLDAILKHRSDGIETRRRDLLEAIEAKGSADLVLLLDAVWRPIFELTDSQNQHSYAAFVASLVRYNRLPTQTALQEEHPASRKLVHHIRSCAPSLSTADFYDRMRVLTMMVAAALQIIDHQQQGGGEAERQFQNVLHMMAAALTASVPSSERFGP